MYIYIYKVYESNRFEIQLPFAIIRWINNSILINNYSLLGTKNIKLYNMIVISVIRLFYVIYCSGR